jgi:hypothetical protein
MWLQYTYLYSVVYIRLNLSDYSEPSSEPIPTSRSRGGYKIRSQIVDLGLESSLNESVRSLDPNHHLHTPSVMTGLIPTPALHVCLQGKAEARFRGEWSFRTRGISVTSPNGMFAYYAKEPRPFPFLISFPLIRAVVNWAIHI